MKIIYIDAGRMPTEKAHGYQICKMCESFAVAGVAVELWLPEVVNEIKENIFEFYKIKENFKIKKLKIYNFFSIKNFFKYNYRLRKFLFFFRLLMEKTEKETFVYTRSPEISFIFNLKGNKVIYENHAWPERRAFLFTFFLKRIYRIITITKHLKEIFLNSGFLERKIMVAPDAVDLDVFNIEISRGEARKKLNLPGDKIIIGYSGSFKTMDMDKGISDILKALKIITEKNNNFLFVAVGGNNDDIEYYQKEARALNLLEYTLFLNRVDIHKLAVYQKSFDILLMPFPYNQHYAYYMSPMKMFEYMASKRPIVASDLPAIREILNEKNAFFVSPDNPEELAGAIGKILNNKELAEKILKQAFVDAQNYSWQLRAANILNFIS